MENTIKLTDKQMSDVIHAAKDYACKEWFKGDIKVFKEWADNIFDITLLTLLDELDVKHDMKTTAEGWED